MSFFLPFWGGNGCEVFIESFVCHRTLLLVKPPLVRAAFIERLELDLKGVVK